jgi:hypothetical protein
MRFESCLASVLLAAALPGCSRGSVDSQTAVYDPATGELRALAYDVNHSGRNNAVMYMDGTRVQRIELDADGNGKVERWDFYGEDGKLARVGLSQRNDGVMDAEALYTEGGALAKLRISTRRDGRFDRTEFYENSLLVRSEDDTDGDGKPDKWDTYESQPDAPAGSRASIASTAIDETGRGRPTRRFVYGARGTIARVEVDPDGNGHFVPLKTRSKP